MEWRHALRNDPYAIVGKFHCIALKCNPESTTPALVAMCRSSRFSWLILPAPSRQE